jgi:hypothetical protein
MSVGLLDRRAQRALTGRGGALAVAGLGIDCIHGAVHLERRGQCSRSENEGGSECGPQRAAARPKSMGESHLESPPRVGRPDGVAAAVPRQPPRTDTGGVTKLLRPGLQRPCARCIRSHARRGPRVQPARGPSESRSRRTIFKRSWRSNGLRKNPDTLLKSFCWPRGGGAALITMTSRSR